MKVEMNQGLKKVYVKLTVHKIYRFEKKNNRKIIVRHECVIFAILQMLPLWEYKDPQTSLDDFICNL